MDSDVMPTTPITGPQLPGTGSALNPNSKPFAPKGALGFNNNYTLFPAPAPRPINAPKKASDFKDDYGLRGLADMIKINQGSKPNSVISSEDLGFTAEMTKAVKPFSEHMDTALAEPLTSLLSSRPVPDEYMVSVALGGSLPRPRFMWNTDLLFFLFYCATNDELQRVAAGQLFDRGWRFHRAMRAWLARWPDHPPEFRTDEMEHGLYVYFDPADWAKKRVKMVLKYSELIDKTTMVGLGASGARPAGGHVHMHAQHRSSATRSYEIMARVLAERKRDYGHYIHGKRHF